MAEKSMEELESLVGTSVVTVEDFEIEAGKVEEFARAVKDDDPVYRDEEVAEERGFDGIPAPLTFERVSMFPRYRTVERYGIDLGFQEEYTIHGEQEYEYERPLVVGDVLTGTTTLVDVYERNGNRGGTMTFAVLETEYTDQDGDLVLTARSTAIETGGAIEAGDADE
ncbi:FAS1-like dehydratase domain-containing protein [Halovenus carboxidivorans]|uniref:FAS1-like dehydratase domain-containing protein n=1 Tax=Halovenus carboxidivorans TaxID=2692199 RepID=UPI0019158321|nr:MaoC family dehydratase N-terminal domain-containing protein [Halovenus carboxidivorans]